MEHHRPPACKATKGNSVCNLYRGHYPNSPHHEIGTGFYWEDEEPIETSDFEDD